MMTRRVLKFFFRFRAALRRDKKDRILAALTVYYQGFALDKLRIYLLPA